jgi:hypothetical protein
MTASPQILFVHPRTDMLLREILPMSLPALVHRLPERPLGRFHDEWTASEVRAARLVVMDVQWYLGLKSAMELARAFKQVNPAVRIVVGGLAATLFARQLVRESPVDYVIRGDAEVPLQELAQAVLNDRSVTHVPNLVSRDFVSQRTWSLTAAELDKNDFRDISFFPTLERRILQHHRAFTPSVPVTIPVFPYLVVYRGCPMSCPMCCGATDKQQEIFHRAWVLRSPGKVREDLEAWSRDGRYKFVNLFHDLVTVLPEAYAREVLGTRYHVSMSYEFFRQPSADQLALLLQAFDGGKLLFPLDLHHNSSPQVHDLPGLIQRIRQAQADGRYAVVLGYVARFLSDPAYRAAVRQARAQTGVALYRVDSWWDDFPLPGATDEDFWKFVSWDDRYWTVNRVFRAGARLYQRFPRVAKMGSHWLGARLKI